MRWPEVMQSMEPDDAATFAVGLVAREAVMLDGQLGKVHALVRGMSADKVKPRPRQFAQTIKAVTDEIAKGTLVGDDTELAVEILTVAADRYETRNRYIHDRLIVSHDKQVSVRRLETGDYTEADVDHILDTYLVLVGSTWQLVALCALLAEDDDVDAWRPILEGNYTPIYGGAVSWPAN